MTIPDGPDAASGEVPTAQLIEVPGPAFEAPPPTPAVIEPESKPEDGARTAPPPRRKPAAVRPSTPLEPPAPEPIEFRIEPEPEPISIDLSPIQMKAEPIGDGSLEPSRVPLRRIVAALATIVGLIGAVGVVAVVIDSRQAGEPKAVDRPAEVALARVDAPPVEVDPKPVPEPRPPEPAPLAVVTPPPAVAPQDIPAPKVEPQPDPPVAPAPAPEAPRPLVIRRRQMLGQEALRVQLSRLPEISLSHITQAMVLTYHGLPLVPQRVPQIPANRGFPVNRGLVGNPGFLGPVLNGPTARPAARQPQAVHQNEMHVAHRRDSSAATIALFKQHQGELGFLPWRMGDACHLDRESAENLELQSRSLRNLLQEAMPEGDPRPDPDTLRASLFKPPPAPGPGADVLLLMRRARKGIAAPLVAPPHLRADVPAAIPALMQLLMAERTPTRQVLVDVLARIKEPAASKALARLAIFDLAPEVREQALVSLRDRPIEDYRQPLLEGLRYPWAPAADHAAEALVALEDRKAVPTLIEFLDLPDPQHARTEVHQGQKVTYSRSLVQVNHLRNCLLCHAPSTSSTSDLVRGRIPDEGLPVPAPREYYGDENSPGTFVRADTTYLRQDFSVTQPVQEAGPWPAYQRYDYVIAERPVTGHLHAEHKAKAKDQATFPQRESVLFALRELTGQDAGNESAAWKDATRPKPPGE